jgi:hypothetical protein
MAMYPAAQTSSGTLNINGMMTYHIHANPARVNLPQIPPGSGFVELPPKVKYFEATSDNLSCLDFPDSTRHGLIPSFVNSVLCGHLTVRFFHNSGQSLFPRYRDK